MQRPMQAQHRITMVAAFVLLTTAACSDRTLPTNATPAPIAASENSSNGPGPNSLVNYDSKDQAEYNTKWANIYGPLELAAGGTRAQKQNGEFTISAVPFHVGADFSVFDHLKYIGVSTTSFPVPTTGSLEFSVRIAASTPGTVPGRVVHGCYGPAFSYLNVGDPCAHPWSATAIEGQQAGVVLNMINFATGQLFDWFVSDHEVFALVERLPSNVTNPALLPSDPGYVGLSKAYTQIIKSAPVPKGQAQDVAIRFSRSPGHSRVEYFLNGQLFASVDNVGIPLDVQHVPFTGIYASYGTGEPLADQLNDFVIGHGLFSLLDAFPFQHPERPDLSVSVPMSERLFGQGAVGTFKNFKVITR